MGYIAQHKDARILCASKGIHPDSPQPWQRRQNLEDGGVEAKLLEDCLPKDGDGGPFVVVVGAVLGHLVAEMIEGGDQISLSSYYVLSI
jgi:hypothetical protein